MSSKPVAGEGYTFVIYLYLVLSCDKQLGSSGFDWFLIGFSLCNLATLPSIFGRDLTANS
jgi:apolipoprotein N-acyltransferase